MHLPPAQKQDRPLITGTRDKDLPENRDARTAGGSLDFLLILCVCLAVYANSFAVGWISDDIRFITGNPSIKSISNVGKFFSAPHGTTASTSGYEGIYRPLRTLSFAADYSIWGLRPFGFHLTNLLWHFIASALVFVVCLRLDLSRRAALAAGVLFAVHPAQVEAVTWIASRADVMAAVFMLASFLLFLQSRASMSSGFAPLIASLLAFIFALLSKETAIVLPILLIAYEVSFRLKHRFGRGLLKHALFVSAAIIYFMGRAYMLHTISQQGYWGGSFLVTVLTMAKCFLIYLKLVFLPSLINCMEYMVKLAVPPVSMSSILPLALVCAFVAGVFIVWQISPVAGFGLGWFLIALAPVSNIFPISMLMAERFLYVPLVGVCIAAAAVFDKADISTIYAPRRLSTIAICIIAGLLGLITIVKNSAWVNPEILWTQTLRQYPDSYRARMGLAYTYYERGQSLEAIKQYSQALQIFPNSQVLHDMGNTYRQMGDFNSAIAAYNSALALDPSSSWTHTSLGITYMLQNRPDRALEEFRRSLEINPTYPITHFYLGVVLEEKGELGSALHEYKTALSYAPDRGDIRQRIKDLEQHMKRE